MRTGNSGLAHRSFASNADSEHSDPSVLGTNDSFARVGRLAVEPSVRLPPVAEVICTSRTARGWKRRHALVCAAAALLFPISLALQAVSSVQVHTEATASTFAALQTSDHIGRMDARGVLHDVLRGWEERLNVSAWGVRNRLAWARADIAASGNASSNVTSPSWGPSSSWDGSGSSGAALADWDSAADLCANISVPGLLWLGVVGLDATTEENADVITTALQFRLGEWEGRLIQNSGVASPNVNASMPPPVTAGTIARGWGSCGCSASRCWSLVPGWSSTSAPIIGVAAYDAALTGRLPIDTNALAAAITQKGGQYVLAGDTAAAAVDGDLAAVGDVVSFDSDAHSALSSPVGVSANVNWSSTALDAVRGRSGSFGAYIQWTAPLAVAFPATAPDAALAAGETILTVRAATPITFDAAANTVSAFVVQSFAVSSIAQALHAEYLASALETADAASADFDCIVTDRRGPGALGWLLAACSSGDAPTAVVDAVDAPWPEARALAAAALNTFGPVLPYRDLQVSDASGGVLTVRPLPPYWVVVTRLVPRTAVSASAMEAEATHHTLVVVLPLYSAAVIALAGVFVNGLLRTYRRTVVELAV